MQHHPLPNAGAIQAPSINALMSATLRMSDILNEESTMLTEMRFKELPALNEEKVKLTKLLESYQQLLARDPSFVRNADAQQREELLLLTDDLAFSVEENFRKVSVAKAVNSRIMQAILDVISEQHRPGTYGRDGVAAQSGDLALSVNLNEKA